jgi:hypothetical protein
MFRILIALLLFPVLCSAQVDTGAVDLVYDQTKVYTGSAWLDVTKKRYDGTWALLDVVEGGGDTAWIGTPSDASGTSTQTPTTGYGSSADRVYCRTVAPEVNITLEALSPYHKVTTWTPEMNVYGLVYVNKLLVAKTQELSYMPTGSWLDYVSGALIVESGESLDADIGDDIQICVGGEFTQASNLGVYSTPGDKIKFFSDAWVGGLPPIDITGHGESETTGLGIILQYVER